MTSTSAQGSRPVVYISGPLQAAADIDKARRFYELLATVCCTNGCAAYLPHERTDPVHHAQTSAQSVFARDLRAVSAADLIVAYVGAPSSGVGAELGIAHERRIPVIGVCGPEGVASRFIEGLIESDPEARLIRYHDEDDCCRLLAEGLEAFVKRHQLASSARGHRRVGGWLRGAWPTRRSPAPS